MGRLLVGYKKSRADVGAGVGAGTGAGALIVKTEINHKDFSQDEIETIELTRGNQSHKWYGTDVIFVESNIPERDGKETETRPTRSERCKSGEWIGSLSCTQSHQTGGK